MAKTVLLKNCSLKGIQLGSSDMNRWYLLNWVGALTSGPRWVQKKWFWAADAKRLGTVALRESVNFEILGSGTIFWGTIAPTPDVTFFLILLLRQKLSRNVKKWSA